MYIDYVLVKYMKMILNNPGDILAKLLNSEDDTISDPLTLSI